MSTWVITIPDSQDYRVRDAQSDLAEVATAWLEVEVTAIEEKG